MDELKKTFFELLAKCRVTGPAAAGYWNEIRRAYSASGRRYHNLVHLQHVFSELLGVKALIDDWDSVLFALFYHDMVYGIQSRHNEENSAELAAQRMKEFGLPAHSIRKVTAHILATKKHDRSEDPDINYFTDADLSILGQPWPEYCEYLERVRQEYHVITDEEFSAGRKKEMRRLFERERIFKTDYFYSRYETQARANISREINSRAEGIAVNLPRRL